MKKILIWASLVTGALSALFWVLSAFAKVPAANAPQTESGGMRDGAIIIGGNNLAATMKLQSKWNSWAAAAAAVTATLQTIANALPDGS